MSQNVVINGYHFAQLQQLDEMKPRWLACCVNLDLKGTILLSPEGVNIALSGPQAKIQQFVQWFKGDVPALQDIWIKTMQVVELPFTKMKVKVKSEIISMLAPDIAPINRSARNLSPEDFKQWLDEKKTMQVLDTRNDYEYEFGTFESAIDLGIPRFKEFKQGLKRANLDKSQPVVTFCTGGVRCEKAALWMEEQGFEEVYQLEGGILNYFNAVGHDHYNGECFVFDDRISVNPGGQETATKQCDGCSRPVWAQDQHSADYVPGSHCPKCVGEVQNVA